MSSSHHDHLDTRFTAKPITSAYQKPGGKVVRPSGQYKVAASLDNLVIM